MTLRRVLALAAAAVVAAMFIAPAAPAQAAPVINGCTEATYRVQPGVTYTVSLAACPDVTGYGYDSASTVTLPYSSTYDFTIASGDYVNTYSYAPVDPDVGWIGEADQFFFVCGDDISAVVGPSPGPEFLDQMANAPVYDLCSSGGQGPAPIIQSVGQPTSGDCASIVDSTLNWGGAADGGWAPSWEQWVNGGLGGAVCTRTLTYNSSEWRWQVS